MWFGGPDHVGREVVVPSGALGYAAHGVPSGFDAGDVRGRAAQRRGVPRSVPGAVAPPGPVHGHVRYPMQRVPDRPTAAHRMSEPLRGSSALMIRRRVPVVVPAPVPRTATTFPTAAGPGRQCRPWSRSMPWATPAVRIPMRPRPLPNAISSALVPSDAGGADPDAPAAAVKVPMARTVPVPRRVVRIRLHVFVRCRPAAFRCRHGVAARRSDRPRRVRIPSTVTIRPLSRLFRLKLVAPRWRCA